MFQMVAKWSGEPEELWQYFTGHVVEGLLDHDSVCDDPTW